MSREVLPDPLTPQDCDLRGLLFMPLDAQRLRDSDLALFSTGDEFKAAVLLWCASWHRVPAGSLPDDDRALCRFSGLDVKAWKKAREGALRGWVKCSDGLLYHEVVAEKAREAWDERRKYRQKRDADRERLAAWRERKQSGANGDDDDGGSGGETQRETHNETPNETRFETRKTVEGSGGKGPSSEPNGSGADAPQIASQDPLADLRAMAASPGAWGLALKVLMDRGGYSEARARPLVGKWSKWHPPERIWQACEAAWTAATLDPVSYISATLERISSEEADPLRNPPESRQRVWMQDWRTAPGAWREHERGPKPGEPGCRITPEVQREFGVEPAKPQPVRGAA